MGRIVEWNGCERQDYYTITEYANVSYLYPYEALDWIANNFNEARDRADVIDGKLQIWDGGDPATRRESEPLPELLTYADVSRLFDTNRTGVWRLMRRGYIPRPVSRKGHKGTLFWLRDEVLGRYTRHYGTG